MVHVAKKCLFRIQKYQFVLYRWVHAKLTKLQNRNLTLSTSINGFRLVYKKRNLFSQFSNLGRKPTIKKLNTVNIKEYRKTIKIIAKNRHFFHCTYIVYTHCRRYACRVQEPILNFCFFVFAVPLKYCNCIKLLANLLKQS